MANMNLFVIKFFWPFRSINISHSADPLASTCRLSPKMMDRPRSTGAEDVLQPPESLSAVVVSSGATPERKNRPELSCCRVERVSDEGQRRHHHHRQQQQQQHRRHQQQQQQQQRHRRRDRRPQQQQPIVIGDSPSPTGSVISISSDPDDDGEDSPHRCAHYKHCVLVKFSS